MEVDMAEMQKISLDDTVENQGMSSSPKRGATLMSSPKLGIMVAVVAVVLGLGTGWFIASKKLQLAGGGPGPSAMAQNPDSAGAVQVGDVFGVNDEQSFRDSAEGIILAGGVDGEGSHHLERGADKSQWVYLTSSVVDLDLFVGHKATIWGETFQGKKAGWLMDVGRVKILELNAKTATDNSMQEE